MEATTHYRTIWISDIHLGTPQAKADFLLDFLRHHEANRYYLVGDIFDGWALQHSWYWPSPHNDVIQGLLRKAKSTTVTYIPGNHDEVARDYPGLQLGGITIEERAVHETAFQLLRLLVANHPFVDGNKRTALASTVVFYGLNGYAFDYDHEMRAILKQLGTDEAEVDPSTVLQYLQKHTEPLPTEYSDTYELLLAVADASDSFGGQNGYDQPDER